MPTRRELFLRAILGPDGAKALGKVAKSSAAVNSVLAPRAALSWLNTRARYEGAIPGVVDSYLRLEKTERGFTGQITLGEGLHTFEDAPPERVAAAVVMSLGQVPSTAGAGRDVDLARLGRTVDLLVKARTATRTLTKGIPRGPTKGGAAKPFAPEPPEPDEDYEEVGGEAKFLDPNPKPKLPKGKGVVRLGLKPLKLSEREANQKCGVCASTQFRAGRFTGCFCLRDLAKSVTTRSMSDGVELTLGRGWDSDAMLTLLEAVGRR